MIPQPFLQLFSLLLCMLVLLCMSFENHSSCKTDAAIDNIRLSESIASLAEIGATPLDAVKRLSFTPEDNAARALIIEWMNGAGMDVKVDSAGNIIGTYPSILNQSGIPSLATGSHIDTVPTGGKYDGALGVLAGLEVVRTLHEHGERLLHPIEVIVFTDEEKTLIGSKAMSGRLDFATLKASDFTTSIGEPIDKCLELIGGNFQDIAAAVKDPSSIAAFVELHVEQGGVLEKRGDSIGVVQGIVGQKRFSISIDGVPNHAGTTPMDMRSDALVAASKLILVVESAAKSYTGPGDPVATVGSLELWPNAANIVPGQVNMTLEMRDLHVESLNGILDIVMEESRRIMEETKTQISILPQFSTDATLAAEFIQETIAEASTVLNLTYSSLPSRAVHDAQEIGKIWPMGMIFVPSKGGYSHSHLEYTSPQQCADGAAVLMQTFRILDARLPLQVPPITAA